MTKKLIGLICIAIVAFFTQTVNDVQALTIKIDDQGSVMYFQDNVLGEDTEKELEHEDEKEREHEQQREKEQERERQKAEKVISSPSDKKERNEVKVQPVTRDKTKVEVNKKSKEKDDELLDKKEVERVKIEFEDKDQKLRLVRQEQEKEMQNLKVELDKKGTPNKEEVLLRKKMELEEEYEKKKAEVEESFSPKKQNEIEFESELKNKLPSPPDVTRTPEQLEQRRERLMKLQDAVRDNKRELELEGDDGVKARFTQGAQISVDAETGTITLTTPSGVTKTLQHFPDEAIEKLKLKANFSAGSEEEIEVEVNDKGEVKHKIKNVTRSRRLLGLFEQKISGEASIDDVTGEVEFTPASQGVFDGLLNALSIE